MHHLSEIRPLEDIKEISEPKVPAIDEKESSLGQLLVENLTSKDFDISRYEDEYSEQLEKLINAKAKYKTHLIKQTTKASKQTQDLIAALKASLAKPSAAKSTKRSDCVYSQNELVYDLSLGLYVSRNISLSD